MSLSAHVSMRSDFQPRRVDSIFNRKRARDIKNLSKSIVPRFKNFRQDFFQAKEEYIKPVFSDLTLIDSKKASFEAYLNNSTAHLNVAVRNLAPAEIKGSETQVDKNSFSVKQALRPFAASPTVNSTPISLVPPDSHKRIRGYLNQQPNDKIGKLTLTLSSPSISSPGIRLTTPSPPLLSKHTTAEAPLPGQEGDMNRGGTTYRKSTNQLVDKNNEAYNNSLDKNNKDICENGKSYFSDEQTNILAGDRGTFTSPVDDNKSLVEKKIYNSPNKEIYSSLSDRRKQDFADDNAKSFPEIRASDKGSRRQSKINPVNRIPDNITRRQSVLENNIPTPEQSRRQSVLNLGEKSTERDSRRQSILKSNINHSEKDCRRQSILNANNNSPETDFDSQNISRTDSYPPEKESNSKRLSVRKMSSHDSGYAAEPTKSMDKSDSVDISEIEAEYFRNLKMDAGSVTSFPLYVNKLAELFANNKRNFSSFLKTEFKNVTITSGKNALNSNIFSYLRLNILILCRVQLQ